MRVFLAEGAVDPPVAHGQGPDQAWRALAPLFRGCALGIVDPAGQHRGNADDVALLHGARAHHQGIHLLCFAVALEEIGNLAAQDQVPVRIDLIGRVFQCRFVNRQVFVTGAVAREVEDLDVLRDRSRRPVQQAEVHLDGQRGQLRDGDPDTGL
ncbi:hypothetical protein D3C79_908320 [compost metagenome]